jgi:hypothetical protein
VLNTLLLNVGFHFVKVGHITLGQSQYAACMGLLKN